MRARLLLCAAFATTSLAAPAAAQLSELWSRCTGKPDVEWRQQITGCTAIIDGKQVPPARLAVAYNNRGVARLALAGETVLPDDRAMADFGMAIKLNPKYADAYFNRGRVWHAAGVFHNAIDLYSAAIKFDPKHAGAYRQRGLAWLFNGNADRAIPDFTTAIRLNPKEAGIYHERGIARANMKDTARALADFSTAIKLDPKYVLAYRDRGSLWLDKDDFDRAAADYGKAAELDPDNARYHSERGYIEFFRGDFAASATALRRAVELRPNDYYAPVHVLFYAAARGRGGEDARELLEAFREQGLFPRLFDLFLGRGSPEEALKDPLVPDDACKEQFIVGQWRLIRGERDEARRLLQEATLDACKDVQPFHRAALIELKRMKR